MSNMMKLVIVSGRSGSGKSICLNVLEDLGFYCIDNLPLKLLIPLVEELKHNYQQIAVSIDSRTAADLEQFDSTVQELRNSKVECEIIYLDASDKVLIHRFSATRRKHPLTSKKVSLPEALVKENKLLMHIAKQADLHIETDNLTVHHLRDLLRNRILKQSSKLTLLFQSFSYKHEIPSNSDFVFDSRCLPNPYWEHNLRDKSGLDTEVQEYLAQQPTAKLLLTDIAKFLTTWIPQFKANDRTYLTISIGCTGGQHRSVYLVEQLARLFADSGDEIQTRHCEL